MSKRTVDRVFVAGLVAIAAGLILLVAAGGLAYANGSFIMDGPDVVGVRSTPFGWSMIGLAVLAIVAMMVGLVAQFVAWIGALVNTAQLADKTWFVVLLLAGLLSLGFIAMVVYVVAGPKDPEQVRPATPVIGGTQVSPVQADGPVARPNPAGKQTPSTHSETDRERVS